VHGGRTGSGEAGPLEGAGWGRERPSSSLLLLISSR
jgi:hypothetical protein